MAVVKTSATSVSSTFLNTLQNPTPTKTDSTGTLCKDSILQLLVTHMNNKNPLDPQDNTQNV
ncbi:flagellar hook capping FlgD N-terminal domain-containing protein, partial [Pseudomonas syringae pv. tagetis]|uniref:flagellar hook capping FlgD N-terminal domain-containing protein n=1 Tax=Pseudomonas syringae group genomosp. 7 TaxID=251699 RepID=UPI00377071AD